jgi:hypothetical protein
VDDGRAGAECGNLLLANGVPQTSKLSVGFPDQISESGESEAEKERHLNSKIKRQIQQVVVCGYWDCLFLDDELAPVKKCPQAHAKHHNCQKPAANDGVPEIVFRRVFFARVLHTSCKA